MPRLQPNLLQKAKSQSSYLPKLLRECRDLQSARNELRWLTEYVADEDRRRQRQQPSISSSNNTKVKTNNQNTINKSVNTKLRDLVTRRSNGEPLQYILGTQPFGDLEILCRKGVLIPRPETEVYTTKVAEVLREGSKGGAFGFGTEPDSATIVTKSVKALPLLRIADFCSGSGCISLLLHSLLCPIDAEAVNLAVEIQGFDISPYALRLSKDNLHHNVQCGALNQSAYSQVVFKYLDVLASGREMQSSTNASTDVSSESQHQMTAAESSPRWDVIITNPPYISPSDYAPGGTTSRSVRMYEPKLALVPPSNVDGEVEQADQFYHAIMQIAQRADSKLVVMEIGDSKQAQRIRDLAVQILGEDDGFLLETWRDDGNVDIYSRTPDDELLMEEHPRGATSAHERAVVVWRHCLGKWRKSSSRELLRQSCVM